MLRAGLGCVLLFAAVLKAAEPAPVVLDTARVPAGRCQPARRNGTRAAKGPSSFSSLSEPGRVHVDEAGRTRFEPGAGGRQRYLIVNEAQRARTLEAMLALVGQPRVLN